MRLIYTSLVWIEIHLVNAAHLQATNKPQSAHHHGSLGEIIIDHKLAGLADSSLLGH